MLWSKVLLLTGAVLVSCESASIDGYLKQCGFGDGECQRDLYRSIIQGVAETGVPELGIPVLDPYVIKNMGIVALGVINITVTDGVLKNFKSCQSNSFHTDTEKLINSLELICSNIVVEGQYILQPTSILKTLIGGIKIHGEGKGGFTADKLKFNFEFPFEIKKLDDGELHFVMDPKKPTYTFDVLGKVTVAFDSAYIGSQDISTVAANIINENWEFISKSIGKNIFDEGIKIFVEYGNKFFATIPVKSVISDDVSSHVTE